MSDWLPGAEPVPGAHAGGTLLGGPPRCTWHITWDRLDPRPTFDGVRDYLVRMNYEPTLLWDPESGRVAQFLPGSRSAYAVRNLPGGVETNRYGDVHVQIEVFFSPGYEGRALFTDGPLVGLEQIMAWLDELGVPRIAAGDFAHPTRDVHAWLTGAGHYGHFNVPENDHSDPIAGSDIARILATTAAAPAAASSPENDIVKATYVKRPDASSKSVYAAFDNGHLVAVDAAKGFGFKDLEDHFKTTLGVQFVDFPVAQFPAGYATIEKIDDGTKTVRNVHVFGDTAADALGIPK